jgi:hypothetical protein
VGEFFTLMPLAVVMIAGPQIISAVFLATSVDWRRSSLAYVGGAALSITTFVTASYFIVKGLKSGASSSSKHSVSTTVDWVVLGLLLFAALHVFLKRHESEPPKWMGKLQDANAKFALTLGVALLGVFPTDIATSFAVGSKLARADDPWWQSLGFIAFTLLLLALPMILVLLMGDRAKEFLPKVRNWMNANSWVVSEFVLAIFIALAISNIVGD